MLTDDLKKLLASQYAFVIKAQFFHWNVEGPMFVDLHKLFGKIYEDVYGAIDPTAEYIRTLDDYAPGSFERFAELSMITGQVKVPKSRLMIQELLADNQTMIDLLNQCFTTAQDQRQEGIANFIAERIDAHGKHGWMLKSLLKDR
jgi:starvation-inducible DNA-binding protein